jgi:hypothetical protein
MHTRIRGTAFFFLSLYFLFPQFLWSYSFEYVRQFPGMTHAGVLAVGGFSPL